MDEKMNELKVDREDYKKVMYRYLILLSIGINIVGAQAVPILNFPAFLDAVGTIFSAVVMGPIIGAGVGLVTNIALGFLVDPGYFYFAGVNILIGVTTGYIFKEHPFNLKSVFVASIFISVIASIVGNTISYMAFGGVAGEQLDRITFLLVERGIDLFVSVNISGFFANLLDKVLSFVIVFCIMILIDRNLKVNEFNIRWK
ncbi:ECF transporter S component [Methanococcus maripaludis]|uniref:Energy-coupling factor transport system substrate-specific component n=1 Tax=Methanococcus maripaludis TaxID=39152 RepID=A0A8T4H5K7_METMI|nr:ECF transporter S component [Methanococcus maripaludis]MBM7408806.1 energy-coupling factor transport system substrate-specific component [Methanococcus maripaludis]MBP2219025.1 energy-coupling factor transport system substrate-specific component [Methanococcus maripaludis]